jgi:uncharacterized protein YcbK (DUF882 family)
VIAALLALSVLMSPPSPAGQTSKKAAYLAAKSAAAKSAAAVPTGRERPPVRRASRPVWGHNLRTHEIAILDGQFGVMRRGTHSEFFRCWFTEKHTDMPMELVRAVVGAARNFGVREVRIISGFRHPKYNLLLRKKGREVARRSQHTKGNAIDFYLPGITTEGLYAWLLDGHPGGVGFYPVSEFVHVDLGKKRTWSGT